MDIATMEDRIKESMLILDSDFKKITTTKDQQAQVGILARMVARQREVDAMLAEQSKLLTSWLRIPKAMNDADRVARLLLAFEFAAKLASIVSDEMSDVKFHNRIVKKMNALVDVLDTIEPDGLSVLAPFLDNANARVRCSAAAYLVDLMPDRALPVLRAVQESERGMNAGMAALFALEKYKIESKAAKPSEP